MALEHWSHSSNLSKQCTCSDQSLQSCPTHGEPMACSPPGPSVHGTLQARILEWVATSFSRGSSRPRDPSNLCPLCLLHWQGSSLPWVSPGKPKKHTCSILFYSIQGSIEKERYKHLNAEFQRIARRDKKAFLRDQCKEIEKTTEWERLEISSRNLKIPRELFMQRWARERTEMVWT